MKHAKKRKFPCGADNPKAKLLDHEVELIRQLLEDGMRQCDAALKFGISRSQVSKIARYVQR